MAAVDPPVRLIMVISLAAEAYATGWESFNGSSYYITAAHMHWDCVTACGEASAKMACLTSSDENAFAASMIRAHGVAFIGTYNPAPKDEHWRCASGEVGRVDYSAWGPGRPMAWLLRAGDSNCVRLRSTGAWEDTHCAMALPCLCERHDYQTMQPPSASAHYAQAINPSMLDSLRVTTAVYFLLLMPALWALPIFVSCFARRGCYGGARRPQRTSSPTASASQGKKEELAAAEAAAAKLRKRVSGSLFQLGWVLLTLGIGPLLFYSLVRDLTPVAGANTYYLPLLALGPTSLLLSISPVEVTRIKVASCIWYAFLAFNVLIFFGGVVRATSTMMRVGQLWGMLLVSALDLLLTPAILSFVCGVNFGAACCSRSGERITPREMLRKLWFTLRLVLFNIPLLNLLFILAPLADGRSVDLSPHDGSARPTLVFVLAFACVSLAVTPRTRGAVIQWLGSLGQTGSREQEATAVAALIGKTDAAEAFSLAQAHFRGLPLLDLTVEEMMHNKPDPAMHAKTASAELGAVHAFVSHSWSDDGAAKYERMHAWAGALPVDKADVLLWLEYAPPHPTEHYPSSNTLSYPRLALHSLLQFSYYSILGRAAKLVSTRPISTLT